MLKSFLVTSLIRALMRSGLQMGALIPQRREGVTYENNAPSLLRSVGFDAALTATRSHLGGRTCTNASSFFHNPRLPEPHSCPAVEAEQADKHSSCCSAETGFQPSGSPGCCHYLGAAQMPDLPQQWQSVAPLIHLSPFQAPKCFSVSPLLPEAWTPDRAAHLPGYTVHALTLHFGAAPQSVCPHGDITSLCESLQPEGAQRDVKMYPLAFFPLSNRLPQKEQLSSIGARYHFRHTGVPLQAGRCDMWLEETVPIWSSSTRPEGHTELLKEQLIKVPFLNLCCLQITF